MADIRDDLIDCGVDILNPVQTSAKGMSAMELKQRAGDRLVFWGGGYDTQLFHPSDSPETVYHRVRETISVLKQGGGYLFSGVHNLPPDVSDAHLRAMMDAWLDERDY